MSRELKDYQIKAVEEIQELFDLFIKKNGRRIVFKAPTGSGKTFMLTKFIERVSLDNESIPFCFIWVSIGKGQLHKQSYFSVKSELKGYPDCQLLDSSYVALHDAINDKQVLFINWEALIKKDKGSGTWKNSLMKDQEGKSFLDLVNETKRRGTKIILIVDESHIGEDASTQTQTFKNDIIDPALTIEMSATPRSSNNIDVEVLLDDVIDEGMIKESLIINKDIATNGQEDQEDQDSIILVLSKAYEKRKKLKLEFEKQKSIVNPLVLIQVPNTDLGDDTIAVVREFLEQKDITIDNGRLAIWIHDLKTPNLRRISKKDNGIEFLIFKTVIDTGWDCPRAHILVKYRDVKSNTSKIQTIGRILRTPESKKYYNEELDNGYVFTNMEYIDPRNDIYSPNRIKDNKTRIKKNHDKSLLGLKSFYKSRQASYNAADTRIQDIIEHEFCKFFGIELKDIWTGPQLEKKGLKIVGIEKSSVMNETITTIKELHKEKRLGGGVQNIDITAAEIELRGKYETIISNNLNGLARIRSLSPIKQSLAKTTMQHLEGVNRSNAQSYTQLLVVKNEEIFGTIISNATDRFKEEYPDANEKGKYSKEDYEIPDEKAFSSATYVEIDSKLSLYEEMYVTKSGTSQLEQRFLNKLDTMYYPKIEWVWHNGSEPTMENFGVMIKIDSHAFRPDFIIKFKDGRIGVFDTKAHNDPNGDITSKANALAKYIEETKKTNPHVFGGIIIEINNIFYLNRKKDYKNYLTCRGDWEPLSVVF